MLKHFANKKNYDSPNDTKSEEKKAHCGIRLTLFIRATSPDEWEQLKRIIVIVITILIALIVLEVVYIQCSLDKILYNIGST